MRLAVGIRCAVAGRGHKQHAGIPRPGNGIIQRLAMTATAPAIAQYAGAFGHSEVYATHRPAHISPAIGTEEFTGHELYFPCNSHGGVTVIGSGTYRASAVSPMAVVIHGVTITVYGVDTVDIIHVSIPVIIHSISGNLAGVHPHLAD